MDFIKQILENAKITDGVLDVEDAMKQINTELPKHCLLYTSPAGKTV